MKLPDDLKEMVRHGALRRADAEWIARMRIGRRPQLPEPAPSAPEPPDPPAAAPEPDPEPPVAAPTATPPTEPVVVVVRDESTNWRIVAAILAAIATAVKLIHWLI